MKHSRNILRLYVPAILIACLLLTTARAQQNLYILHWINVFPVQLHRVEVTGGSLIQLLTDGDDTSGTITVLAPRECVSIAAEGQTTAGIRVRFVRSWDFECDRVWAPLVWAEHKETSR